jgi:hypothetical protein
MKSIQAKSQHADEDYPITNDGRYFVVRGRLWRRSNPGLPDAKRAELVSELMSARRAVAQGRKQNAGIEAAHARVDVAKQALGERGAVWWNDGARDYNRHMAKNTPYAEWYKALIKE